MMDRSFFLLLLLLQLCVLLLSIGSSSNSNSNYNNNNNNKFHFIIVVQSFTPPHIIITPPVPPIRRITDDGTVAVSAFNNNKKVSSSSLLSSSSSSYFFAKHINVNDAKLYSSSSSLNNSNDNNDNGGSDTDNTGTDNSSSSSTTNSNSNSNPPGINKIRLNKVFKNTHSRREADKLINEGRVSINNIPVISKGGYFVIPYVDEIKLDNILVQGWEELNYITKKPKQSNTIDNNNNNNNSDSNNNQKDDDDDEKLSQSSSSSLSQSKELQEESHNEHKFEYIKYWKPKGIICTTDLNIPYNIINELRNVDGYTTKSRIYPVGRLDKDTSGLILLTNDGRLPNSSLRQQYKRPKVYELKLNYCIEGKKELYNVIQKLSNGVIITTETVRNGVRKSLTALTKPCYVEPIYTDSGDEVWWLRVILEEGRNRQVRKMINAIGYSVIELERVSFADITLQGLNGPGNWEYLNSNELNIIQDMIQIATTTISDTEENDDDPSSTKEETTSTTTTATATTTATEEYSNNNDEIVVDDNNDDNNDADADADDDLNNIKSSLNKLTIPQLKEKLRLHGMKVSGKKQDLISRLLLLQESATEESVSVSASISSTATATTSSSDADAESESNESSLSQESSPPAAAAAAATLSRTRRTPQEYSNNDDDYSDNNDYNNDANGIAVGW